MTQETDGSSVPVPTGKVVNAGRVPTHLAERSGWRDRPKRETEAAERMPDPWP